MRPSLLTDAQRMLLLQDLPDWRLSDDGITLYTQFKFANFRRAFAFMSEMALAAEALDHHPDWQNSYSLVNVRLTTHEVAQHDGHGLTILDEKLARMMSDAAARLGAKMQKSA